MMCALKESQIIILFLLNEERGPCKALISPFLALSGTPAKGKSVIYVENEGR